MCHRLSALLLNAHSRRQQRDLVVRQDHEPVEKSELVETRGVHTYDPQRADSVWDVREGVRFGLSALHRYLRCICTGTATALTIVGPQEDEQAAYCHDGVRPYGRHTAPVIPGQFGLRSRMYILPREISATRRRNGEASISHAISPVLNASRKPGNPFQSTTRPSSSHRHTCGHTINNTCQEKKKGLLL